MNEEQKTKLATKRLHLQMQLKAQSYIRRGVAFAWIDYFNAIKKLGLQYKIESICQVTTAALPFYAEAILALNNPDIQPEMITVSDKSISDMVFNDYPSTSDFKYVMNLPLLSAYDSDVAGMLQKAQEILQITNEQIYFLSADCAPVLELQWNEIVQHGNTIFDDSCISLIFTNKIYSWIIFRSIENEWRCGRTDQNY